MKALSQLMSFVLTVLISVSALSVFIFGINPTLKRVQEEGYIDQMFNNMRHLAVKMEDLVLEGIGSSRQMSLDVPEGMLLIKNDTDTLEYTIITSSNVLPNGTNITRDGIQFTSFQLSGRQMVEVKLSYSNIRINITDYLRLPKGNYNICIKKSGEDSSKAAIEVKNC